MILKNIQESYNVSKICTTSRLGSFRSRGLFYDRRHEKCDGYGRPPKSKSETGAEEVKRLKVLL